MSLNLNYGLFMEGANSKYKLPSYKTTFIPYAYGESYISEILTEFNYEIMEAQQSLNNICNEAVALDEASIDIVKIKETFSDIIGTVIEKIKSVGSRILDFIKKIIATISEKAASIKDSIEQKHSMHERNNLLAKAIREASPEEKKITISDIHPTAELLNKDFPDTSVIGEELAKMASDAVDNYCSNINLKDGSDPNYLADDIKSSESLASYLEGEKGNILSRIFGKYSVDPTDITGSAMKASEAAFGTKEAVSTDLNLELYGQACENLDKWKEISADLNKEVARVEKAYRDIEATLEGVKNETKRWEKLATPNYSTDLNARYHEGVREITSNINKILNVVQVAVSANAKLLTDKAFRINQIFSPMGDSGRVKRHCHALMRKYLNIEDGVQEAVNGVESFGSDIYFDQDFYSAVAMAENAYNEAEFNDTLYEYLIEANEGNGNANDSGATTDEAQPAADGQQQQQTQDQTQNKVGDKLKNAQGAVQGFIDKLINSLTEAFNKFKSRITDLVTVVFKGYWEKNKEKIAALDNNSFGQTKVNQWFVYRINNGEGLNKDIVVDFDINNDSLKTDEACQDAILKTIGQGAQFGDKDGFGEKVKKSFYTEYKDDKNGEGVLLNQAGFDAVSVYTYVDDCMKPDMQGSAFSSIKRDFDKINSEAKRIKEQKDNILSQMKVDQNAQPAEASGEADKNANGETAGNNGNANASYRFDLADHFGLMKSAPLFEAVTPDPNVVQGDTTNGGSGNKEFDARVRRYIKYNSLAVTAKMTSAIGAFKQYMDLYRAIIKDNTKQENANGNNNNQNNNQQQNDQNQNQEQNQNNNQQ